MIVVVFDNDKRFRELLCDYARHRGQALREAVMAVALDRNTGLSVAGGETATVHSVGRPRA